MVHLLITLVDGSESTKMRVTSRAKAIAFYLPQFHPVKENDLWHGKDFTEWTNTAKARPLFEGHYQPHIPDELGYYDLSDPGVRLRQAKLAKEYRIEAFCYYHYWFAGRRILEKPFDEVLRSNEPDMDFCLCWANESWTGIWHGAPKRMLIEQTYPGRADHIHHFENLIPAFLDDRYVTVENKPLFLILNPADIPDIKDYLNLWQSLARKVGLRGLYMVGIRHWDTPWNPEAIGFDASITIKIPPRPSPGVVPRLKKIEGGNLICFDHRRIVDQLLNTQKMDWMDYPCIGPNWDNTPRCGNRGLVLDCSRPELFRKNVKTACSLVRPFENEHRLIFIKSWNEWGEGNHLEPDLRFRRQYLEVLRNELTLPERH